MNIQEIKFATLAEKQELVLAEGFELPYVLPEGHLARDWQCLIIKDQKEYLAFCSLEVHAGFEQILWISTLSVIKTKQKQGLGAALIKSAVNYGRELYCSEVRTWAHEVYAKRLWEKERFTLLSGVALDQEGNSQMVFKYQQ